MRHIALDLPVVVLAGLVMAAMVLAGGNVIHPPSSLVVPPSLATEPPAGAASTCLEAPVTAHTASGVDGTAELCVGGRDVRVRLHVDGVTPGKVYTAWFSYIAQPGYCRDLTCGPADFFGETPIGLLEQIAGGVAPPSKMLELAGELRDLELVSGAQVTLLLLRPRGPAGLHSQAVFIIP
jgi:hypothetical protein